MLYITIYNQEKRNVIQAKERRREDK